MSTPQVINQKLLCASAISYNVDNSGVFVAPVKGDQNFNLYNNSGFIGEVVPFTNKGGFGVYKIDAAIFVEMDFGYVLAFRGTLSPGGPAKLFAKFEDWAQDILESDTTKGDGLPGLVHEGFYNAFKTLWNKINTKLEETYAGGKNASKPLYITGHSKGGPMASYAAYIVKSNSNYPFGGITTFASPYPGNSEFASAYKAIISQTSFENYLDIVPFLPPKKEALSFIIDDIDKYLWIIKILLPKCAKRLEDIEKFLNEVGDLDYTSVGTLQYITKDSKIIDQNPDLLKQRIQSFKDDLDDHNKLEAIKLIGAAHAIGCGGGYQKGVYPEGCMVELVT